MVDCHACEKRNKGVTFHKLRPASDDKTTQEWRNRLISVISRSDNSFNPDKAYICSRHFDDDCFIPHGRTVACSSKMSIIFINI